jgi:hypothetical protein
MKSTTIINRKGTAVTWDITDSARLECIKFNKKQKDYARV